MKIAVTLAAAGLALVLAGCHAASGPVDTPPAPGPVEAGAPAAPAQPEIKYTEGDLKALEARLAENPKDAALQQEVAEASFQVGYTIEHDPDLRPMVKYPAALKLFRRALELDPGHERAAAEKKQIEDIYRSMGRPIPGES